MSETATEKNEVRKPAKFDLSDGISSEDFIALGSGLLRIIVFILKIVFFPLIWVKRMIGKLQKFLFSPHAERLLTEDEKVLISSTPVFLGFLGLTLGAIIGILAYLNSRDNFLSRLQNITDFLKFLGGLIKGFFQFLGLIWGFIYEVILKGSASFIVHDIFQSQEPLIPFIVVSIVSFLGAIAILVVLELSFVRTFLQKVSDLVNYVVTLPFRFYERLQDIWKNIITKIGDPVMGGQEMLGNYTNKFYQKVLRLIMLFAIIFISLGLYIFLTDPVLAKFEDFNSYIYLILFMVLVGLFSGFPVAYLIVRFLKSLSKDKYEARTVISVPKATASGTPTSGSTATKEVPAPRFLRTYCPMRSSI